MWRTVLQLSLCSLMLNMSPCSCDEPVVTTPCGPIAGVSEDGAYSFRGIRYAEPPVGNMRWQAPVPTNSCWEGTLNATSFGNTCYHADMLNRSKIIGDEDCLFVNVWTPTLDPNASLHVMVWIHGGYNLYLNGNWPNYSPTSELAKSTNVVYVSMNYRMHVFGFMALDILSQASTTGTSGNYGLMDQILALKWVKHNVNYFGGDPEKVTIFGQSSGGTDIFALLASDLASGLFHKAWMTSTSPVMTKSVAEASQDNLVFLQNTGCSNLTCLQELSAEEIVLAIPWEVFPNWAMNPFNDLPTSDEAIGQLPVIDGYVLTDEPLKAWLNGNINDVPLMIGTTAQETDFFPGPVDVVSWTWDDYEEYVTSKLSTFGLDVAEAALKLYPRDVETPQYQFTTMTTDIRLTCQTEIIAYIASLSLNSSVYRYVATAWPSQPTYLLGFPFPATCAFHAIDIIAFFGSLADEIGQETRSDRMFKDQVRRTIISFVKDNNPANRWHPFPEVTALISDRLYYVPTYKARECQYWLYAGFFDYGWSN